MKIISKKKKKKETERDKGFYFIYPRCWPVSSIPSMSEKNTVYV